MVSVSLLFLTTSALGAEVTEMPAARRGHVRLEYEGRLLRGTLLEEDAAVGHQRKTRHQVSLHAEVAPYEGVAAWLELPVTPSWRLSWQHPRHMIYDPGTGTGTLAAGPERPVGPLEGGGVGAPWLGAAVSPYSQRYGQPATWRLDAGFRAPIPTRTVWAEDEAGRGARDGGFAWMTRAAFSAERGVADPWLDARYQHEHAFTAEDGLKVRPASTLDIRAGIDLLAYHDPNRGQRGLIGGLVGVGYRTASEIPSGMFLPSVLDATGGQTVLRSDHLVASGGLSVRYEPSPYVGLRLATEARLIGTHRVEHLYPVYTGPDTHELVSSFALEGRLR